ncbi:MAG: tetratricopeptide repeat protein, partial [bacterium]|nr:tetratricopeptide repeat protein [bacterium]
IFCIKKKKKALGYLKKAHSIWEVENEPAELCAVYANIALALLKTGATGKSEDFIEYAVETAPDVGETRKSINVRSIYALNLLYSADFAGAIREADAVSEQAEESGYTIGLSYIYGVMARSKRVIGEIQEALRYSEKSYNLIAHLNNPTYDIECLSELAILSTRLGKFDKVETYLNELNGITSDNENVTVHRDMRKSLVAGELSFARDDIQGLLEVTGSITGFVENCDDARKYEAGLRLARFYRELGDIGKAVETTGNIYEWSKERGFPLARLLASALLTELHINNKNNDEATRYFSEVGSIVDANAGPYWRDWFNEFEPKKG